MRNNSLDNINGVLITFMFFYHVVGFAGLSEDFYIITNIFSFFMPWFFFKSGMFFKEEKFIDIYHKSIKRLIYPFIYFSIIGHFIYCLYLFFVVKDFNIIHYTLSPIKQLLMYGSIAGNLPLWFLLSLFAVRIIFFYVYKNKYLISLLVAIPYLVYIFEINIPLYFVNVFSGLFFYSCGYFLKKHQYNNKFFLIAFGIYFLALILCPSYIDMRTNNLVWGNYYWYYIVALAGIITINGLFFYLTKKEIPVLNILGKNSMAILCIHWLVLYCVKIIFPNLQGFSFLIVSALLVIIVMPIIILWIRHTKLRNFI